MTLNLAILTAALVLAGVGALCAAPTADAHVCLLDYTPSCVAAPCGDDGGIHVHLGNRVVPCASIPTDLLP